MCARHSFRLSCIILYNGDVSVSDYIQVADKIQLITALKTQQVMCVL